MRPVNLAKGKNSYIETHPTDKAWESVRSTVNLAKNFVCLICPLLQQSFEKVQAFRSRCLNPL